MDGDDDDFMALPANERVRIDDAFRAQVTDEADAMVQSMGGGFLLEGPIVEETTRIPLNTIPQALEILGLPPDDPTVLTVFENAAVGWGVQGNSVSEGSGSVSLRDFRSVCAILLLREDNQEQDTPEDSDQDMYAVSSGDEYQTPSAPQKSRKRKRILNKGKQRASSVTSSAGDWIDVEQECLQTFSLFFPEKNENDLVEQKISLKELKQAVERVGMHVGSQELQDMLTVFSASSKVDLETFKEIMRRTKLLPTRI